MTDNGRGRPSTYTNELAAEICKRLADGRTLRDVARDDDMPSESTVRTWALDDREGFAAQYARAREIGYNVMADETLGIADDGSNDWMERSEKRGGGGELNGEHVQRSRLRVDTRKWLLSKALPKIYGDKLLHTGGDGEGAIKLLVGWKPSNTLQSTTPQDDSSLNSTTEQNALPASLP